MLDHAPSTPFVVHDLVHLFLKNLSAWKMLYYIHEITVFGSLNFHNLPLGVYDLSDRHLITHRFIISHI